MEPARRSPRRTSAKLEPLRNAVLFTLLISALYLLNQGYTDTLPYAGAAIVGIAVALILLQFDRPRSRQRPVYDKYAARDGAAGRTRTLSCVFVIDGDTVDDTRGRIRYRLQNIDAPETGDNARCESERRLGERAKWDAIALVRSAHTIQARPTGEIDRYGRTLAYILIDGRDLGELLIQRGVAHPWRGRRELWCGPYGSLLSIARQRGDTFFCETCRLQCRP